jgi:hypothetical protein
MIAVNRSDQCREYQRADHAVPVMAASRRAEVEYRDMVAIVRIASPI